MKKTAQFAAILIFICFSHFAGVAYAADYYVSKSGVDQNPGTTDAPFRTINRGVSVLRPGDTLWVRSGVYAESLLYNVPSGTSWSRPVRIAAEPGAAVTMRPNYGVSVLRFAGSSGAGNYGEQQYIEFDGIDLDGTSVTNDVIKIEEGEGYRGHHIRIKNCTVRMFAGPYGNAILLVGLRPDAIGSNEFQNIRVTGGGPVKLGEDFSSMFYIQTPNNLIENSVIEGGIGAGIQIYNGNWPGSIPDNQTLRNNVIRDFTTSPRTRLYGIIVAGGSGHRIYGNTITNIAGTGGESSGIYLFSGANTDVYDNIVYGNALYGIHITQWFANARLFNNEAYHNGAFDLVNYGWGTIMSDNGLGKTN